MHVAQWVDEDYFERFTPGEEGSKTHLNLATTEKYAYGNRTSEGVTQKNGGEPTKNDTLVSWVGER